MRTSLGNIECDVFLHLNYSLAGVAFMFLHPDDDDDPVWAIAGKGHQNLVQAMLSPEPEKFLDRLDHVQFDVADSRPDRVHLDDADLRDEVRQVYRECIVAIQELRKDIPVLIQR